MIRSALVVSLWFFSVVLHADASLEDAEAAFLLEDYGDVIDISDQLLIENPLEVDALFLKASALLEQGKADEGSRFLETYLQQPAGQYRGEARALLETADPVSTDSLANTDMFFQLGLVHDSRVLSSRDTAPFFEEEADQAVRARFAFDYQHAAGWLARYRGYLLNYLRLSEERRFEHAVEGGYLFNSLGGSLEWVGSAEYLMKDFSADQERIATRIEQAWIVAESKIGWIGLEVGQDRFPDADIFDGSYFIGSIGLEDYRDRVSIFYDAYAYRHEAEIDELAYLEAGGGFVAAYQATDQVGLGFGMRASAIQFDEEDTFLGFKRDDTYFSARLWSSHRRNAHFSVVPSVEYVNNASNADFANFDEYIVGIDFTWAR